MNSIVASGVAAVVFMVVGLSCSSADEPEPALATVEAPGAPAATVAGPPAVPYAGNGLGKFAGDGGPAVEAQLHGPAGLTVDSDGNLFIATDHRVRRVDATTGIITTVAGTGTPGFSGDGAPATSARLKNPTGVAVDSGGNVFVADHDNGRIRRIDSESGVITTVAGGGKPTVDEKGQLEVGDGGPATEAFFRIPMAVAVDQKGNLFFVANQTRVRRVDAITGIITTLAGDGTKGLAGDGGPADVAVLAEPGGLAVDGEGNLYISDTENSRIRRVDAATGVIATVAGVGRHGSFVQTDWYVGDRSSAVPTGFFQHGDCRLRPEPVEGAGFSGDGGPAPAAMLAFPVGLAFGPDSGLYIADHGNNRVRRLDVESGVIATVADGGTIGADVVRCIPGTTFNYEDATAELPAGFVNFSYPVDVAVGPDGSLYVADFQRNQVVKVALD